METFVEILRSFDRHERGILLRWATGRAFALAPELRRELEAGAAENIVTEPAAYQRSEGFVTDSPEDVDLLIAWEDDQRQLILIEAKGFTGWINKQMTSKAKRLRALFSALDDHRVDRHFVLVGPRESTKIDFKQWPAWKRPNDRVHFLTLPMPRKHRSVERGLQTENSWTRTQTDWSH